MKYLGISPYKPVRFLDSPPSASSRLLPLLILILLISWLGLSCYFPQPTWQSSSASQPDPLPLRRPAPDGWRAATRPLVPPLPKSLVLPLPTAAQRRLSARCTEQWIATGSPCLPSQLPPAPIDLIWTWVNGSATQTGPSYLYRQHDELRYSLRSTVASFPARFVRSRQIITADEPVEGWVNWPTWLTADALDGVIARHHSEIFKPGNAGPDEATEWRKAVVPSHNSLAIESQLGHLDGIKDHVLYLNDDCFFLNKFSEADFATEWYGPVFRLQFDLHVKDDSMDRSGSPEAQGEWPSLGYSNRLLSKRFGSRDRRYLLHLPKVLSVEIIKEVSEVWKDELFETASSRFRGQRREANMMFLCTWYHIEKHREALLHSFVMLKTDANQDGILSNSEWNNLKMDISSNGRGSATQNITVYQPLRPRGESVEELLGVFQARQTEYQWLSTDGYPLVDPETKVVPNVFDKETGRPSAMCTLDVVQCFPRSKNQRTEDLFKFLAFERPECGDCLIGLLVGKAERGMDAFLPRPGARTVWARLVDSRSVARDTFASATPDWQRTRFFQKRRPAENRMLGSQLLADDPRTWAVRNVQRYQYVLGDTWNEFQALTTTQASERLFDRLRTDFVKPHDRKPNPKGLMVTINDRIVESHAGLVAHKFREWLAEAWPVAAGWEKEVGKTK